MWEIWWKPKSENQKVNVSSKDDFINIIFLFVGAAAKRVKNTEEYNNRVIAGVRKQLATFTSSQLGELISLTEDEKAARARI